MNTRRPIERIYQIHQLVRRGKLPNCRIIAEKLEVTAKTVQRDINFMRDDLGLPLVYDEVQHGYYYDQPVGEFPLLKSTAEDLVSLFLARQALAPLEGTALESTLREGFRRISASVPGEVTLSWDNLEQILTVREAGIARADIKLFERVAKAVLQSRQLEFGYKKLGARRAATRVIEPYHLAEIAGSWYVIGNDLGHGELRTFAVVRMEKAQVLRKRFIRPPDFDPQTHLGDSFGVWSNQSPDGKKHRVRIRVTGWAARVVAERRWHPSQEIKEVGDDTIEVFFELGSFQEVTRWALSLGGCATVLEPKALRESFGKEIRAMLKNFQES